MKQARFYCESEAEQIKLGKFMAQNLSLPLLVFLKGDLGTGKTTLSRSIIQSSGYSGAVRSPTYTLLEPYDFDDKSIYHLDLYRLSDGEELEYLGLREILEQKNALLLIEWPENGIGWLPNADLTVALRHQNPGRSLEFSSNTENGITLIDKLQAMLPE